MRKEPYGVGSIVHVIKRGAHGIPIVRDEEDRQRFLLMLTHFNDIFSSENWFRDIADCNGQDSLLRPSSWPEQNKITKILAFCLVENHFHLLLEEIAEGGISRFMQRMGTAMAKRYNEKYFEKGALFQGPYRSRTISDDEQLRYIAAYIQVKNAFELYPGGYSQAAAEFDKAYAWASQFKFSSLVDYENKISRPIVDTELLSKIFTPDQFKDFSRDVIIGRSHLIADVKTLE